MKKWEVQKWKESGKVIIEQENSVLTRKIIVYSRLSAIETVNLYCNSGLFCKNYFIQQEAKAQGLAHGCLAQVE